MAMANGHMTMVANVSLLFQFHLGKIYIKFRFQQSNKILILPHLRTVEKYKKMRIREPNVVDHKNTNFWKNTVPLISCSISNL